MASLKEVKGRIKLHKWNAENYVGDENGCLFEAA